MHANRLYTNKTHVIPQAEAAKYPGLVTMSTDGSYKISDTLEQAITDQQNKLSKETLQRAKDTKQNKPYTKKRPRPPPH